MIDFRRAVRRPAPPPPRGPRLLREPVFIFSSVRSGSTLLRVVLDSHSRLYAPHELHLAHIKVELSSPAVQNSMNGLGLNKRELEHLLWDRIMDCALQQSGKEFYVNKTPNDVFVWRRIAKSWPDARYLFLLRHPGEIFRSWHQARPWSEEEALASTVRYLSAVQSAREALPGLTVRYEKLTAQPEQVTRDICAHLKIDWEPAMLDYGAASHGQYRAGFGDWKDKIKSGRIQEVVVPADIRVPAELVAFVDAWGYGVG